MNTENSTMRKDLIKRIEKYLNEYSLDHADFDSAYKNFIASRETIRLCTTEQLWNVYTLIEQGIKFEVIPCNPKDHLALSYDGMYVGIETDGYRHT